MNFKKGMKELLKHPMNEAQFAFDISRGKIKPKDAMGDHQRMMNKWTVPLFGDNKVSKNSDAIAAAIVGSFFAGPAMAAAGGSSAGGGAAGAGGTGAMGLGSTYVPTTAFGAGSTGSAFGSTAFGNAAFTAGGAGGGTGAMGLASSYAPTTAFGSTAVAGQGLGMSGYAAGSGAAGSGIDLEAFGKALQSFDKEDKTRAKGAPLSGGASGRGFTYDRKALENPLVSRTYDELYNQPLYSKPY